MGERDVVVIGRGSMRLFAGDSLDVVRILLGHLLDGDLDNDSIELVKTDLAPLETQELGFDLELSGLVVPNSGSRLRRS